MYGVFDNYPTIVHARASLVSATARGKLQSAIVSVFRRLNAELEDVADTIDYGVETLTCRYEIGVADGYYFNFLDEEEEQKLLRTVDKTPLQILDLLIRVTYTRLGDVEKPRAVKSDYHLARFDFRQSDSVTLTVHHDKGVKWLPLDVLIRNLVARINVQLQEEHLDELQTAGIWGR